MAYSFKALIDQEFSPGQPVGQAWDKGHKSCPTSKTPLGQEFEDAKVVNLILKVQRASRAAGMPSDIATVAKVIHMARCGATPTPEDE